MALPISSVLQPIPIEVQQKQDNYNRIYQLASRSLRLFGEAALKYGFSDDCEYPIRAQKDCTVTVKILLSCFSGKAAANMMYFLISPMYLNLKYRGLEIDVTGLFHGAFLRKLPPKMITEDTLDLSANSPFYKKFISLKDELMAPFVSYLDKRVEVIALERLLGDKTIAMQDIVDDVLLENQFDFNEGVLNDLESDIFAGFNGQIEKDTSHIYYIAVNHLKEYVDSMPESWHTFVLEQYRDEDDKVVCALYQSWVGQATLPQDMAKRLNSYKMDQNQTATFLTHFRKSFSFKDAPKVEISEHIDKAFGYATTWSDKKVKPVSYFLPKDCESGECPWKGISVAYLRDIVSKEDVRNNLRGIVKSSLLASTTIPS